MWWHARAFGAAHQGSLRSLNDIQLKLKQGKIADQESRKQLEQHMRKMQSEGEIREEQWKAKIESQRY